MFFRKKTNDFDNKISELKKAMNDELFLSDMKEISKNIENIDLEEWNE